jgi:hypothetical protein
VRQGDIIIEGHAIVSADGMIADADGAMPAALMNAADWRLFQSSLDAAALVVLGRRGHERHPNPGRRRLVLTRAVEGLVPDPQDPLASRWNPDHVTFNHVLNQLGIAIGVIAVTGGTAVFDRFLDLGYDRFALSTARRVSLPGGRPCFSDGSPGELLAANGLALKEETLIDPAADVWNAVWSR